MIGWLRRLIAPKWIIVHDGDLPRLPTVTGHYRVIINGDNETCDGYVIYDYPDYETWAWFAAPEADEIEMGDDDYRGTFTGTHDEETDMVFAWCGPFTVPKRAS